MYLPNMQRVKGREMSNTEERDAMRDDGLIHARNGNLKSMQHASSEAHAFAKYEQATDYKEVQESQIKRNEELFKREPDLGAIDSIVRLLTVFEENAKVEYDDIEGDYYMDSIRYEVMQKCEAGIKFMKELKKGKS